MTNKTSKLLKIAGISALGIASAFGAYEGYKTYLEPLGYESRSVEGTTEEKVLYKVVGESIENASKTTLENYSSQR